MMALSLSRKLLFVADKSHFISPFQYYIKRFYGTTQSADAGRVLLLCIPIPF